MRWDWRSGARFLGKHWPSTILASILIIATMTPHALERFFVYYPMREVTDTPSSIGLNYEDLALVTEDRVRLHGWFVPCENARVTLLIFHGNAGNIGHRVPWIELLNQAGAHVAIIDYRGYGRSGGKPHEQGLYRDARAAFRWWSEQRGGKGEKLVLVGESLGGAVAVDLAARAPVTGLILQSTFTTAWDMAKTLMPIGLLQPVAGVHFDSAGKIAAIRCPKLFIHGEQDEVVPFRLGKKLYELAPPPKDFYSIPGAMHNDLPWVAGPEYTTRIREFLKSLW